MTTAMHCDGPDCEAWTYSVAPVACTVNLSSYATPGATDSRAGVHNAMRAVANRGGGTICVDGMYKVRNFIDLDIIPRSADTKITREEFDNYAERLLPLDLAPIYDSLGSEALGEKYCTTDVCEIKTEGTTP